MQADSKHCYVHISEGIVLSLCGSYYLKRQNTAFAGQYAHVRRKDF